MANSINLGHLIVFIVIGSLIGYSPLSAGIIRKTKRASDTIKRFLAKASVLSLMIALVCVTIYDRYQHIIPWSEIPNWFWYLLGAGFAGVGIRKYMTYRQCRLKTVLYNAGWYALAGLLIILYETMDPEGTGGFIITTIVLILATAIRFMYWKQIHHHAKE